MKLVDQILTSQFGVNWRTILVGWEGVGDFGPVLFSSDVVSYALRKVEESPDEQPKEVILLLAADSDSELVGRCLGELARQETADPTIETRKWRLILLKSVMRDPVLQDRLPLQQFYRFSQYLVSDVPSADPTDLWLHPLFLYYKILGVIFSLNSF